MNPQETPRVVSKSQYLRYLSQKATLVGSGALLGMLGVAGVFLCAALLVVIIMCAIAFWSVSLQGVGYILVMTTLCLLVGALFVFMAWFGSHQLQKADRMEPLVPLTRENANQLPSEQSLVRASSEPSEVQQDVLLRAAGFDAHTLPEELLRATTGEERP